MKYAYSTDNEYYYGDFESINDAINKCKNDNPYANEVWIGEKSIVSAHNFTNGKIILEYIAESAYCEVGESAEDWLQKLITDKNKCVELQKIIGDWIERNDPVKFFTVDNEILINEKNS